MSDDYKAIDTVVNIWTAEALSHRPGWTDELIEALTDVYDEDVFAIERLPGVNLITP